MLLECSQRNLFLRTPGAAEAADSHFRHYAIQDLKPTRSAPQDAPSKEKAHFSLFLNGGVQQSRTAPGGFSQVSTDVGPALDVAHSVDLQQPPPFLRRA